MDKEYQPKTNSISQRQVQKQVQKQYQKMSQQQILALKFLSMNNKDLREEILKNVNENPALEIVYDPLTTFQNHRQKESYSEKINYGGTQTADAYQQVLESQENRGQTLQQHLMEQLNMTNVSPDEYELSQKLIYNLDSNGCYGSKLAPETLLNKARPVQNLKMLEKCIKRIQQMDPIGTCCKNLEESLFVQAQIANDASPVTLFLLDGHLEMLSPPVAEKVLKKINDFKEAWHSKKFASKLPIDEIKITLQIVEEAVQYILKLNPHPAAEYISDTSLMDFNKPDVILSVTKEKGFYPQDDFSKGIVAGGNDFYFQIKYSNGEIPEIKVSDGISFNKEAVKNAQAFINLLEFRQTSMVLQGCAITKVQKDFFINGPGNLNPLTRRQIASQLNIHESTVSRFTSKKSNKYIQTEWGLFPASYFFSTGLKTQENKKISSESIKILMLKILENKKSDKPISDSQLTTLLNKKGISISRRTVNKYRIQLGLDNSYNRNN